jgi:hypothetical protein
VLADTVRRAVEAAVTRYCERALGAALPAIVCDLAREVVP